MKLTSEQKKYLKGLGHTIEPQVYYGKSGITPELIREIENSLLAHELIKLKFNQGKEEKKSLAEEIANKTDSNLVAVVGNNAILFRQQKVTEKRKIKLPK
jgi:RNA-binding protein